METTGEVVLEFLVATNLKLKGKKSKERRGETNTLRYLRPREAHGHGFTFFENKQLTNNIIIHTYLEI